MNLREIGRRLVMLISRRRFDRELAEEMQLHLDLRAAREVERGAAVPDAAHRARRAFGERMQFREESRDAWGWRSLDDLTRTVRHSARLLRKSPLFTTAAIATMAIGIGANVAIFGLIDRVLLHPIDAPDPSGLVAIQRTSESRGVRRQVTSMTWENARRVRDMSTMDSAVSSSSTDRASKRLLISFENQDIPDTADGRFVSANYFRVIGLKPELGRDFVPADDELTASAAVILSHRYWRVRFGADSGVIGRTVRINGVPTVIIGVASKKFSGIELGVTPTDLYLPLMLAPRLATDTGTHTDGRGTYFNRAAGSRSEISPVADLMVFARVTPGGRQAAQSQLEATFTSGSWTLAPLAETMLPSTRGGTSSGF